MTGTTGTVAGRAAWVPPTPRGTAAPWLVPGTIGVTLVVVVLGRGAALVDVVASVTEVVFIAYFLRHAAFAVTAVRGAPADLVAPGVPATGLPRVTVVVACRDERSVVDGLLVALDRLDYPPDRLDLVLIDDGSTDGTGARLDELATTRPALTVIHRPDGAGGGKAGALGDALPIVTGDVVAVFDADHRPASDGLTRLVRALGPGVAVVQGRCGIRNAAASWISRVVAVDYLAGYFVDEYGRQAMAGLPACGGANYVVRTDVLRSLGGWNPDSVTEDTDLTLRLTLAGWRIRYDVTAADTEEAVTTLRRYWSQRYRWARGHQQACRVYRRAVVGAPHLSVGERLEALLFLHAYHVPVLSAVGLALLSLWAGGVVHPTPVLGLPVLWTLLFLGPLVELGTGLVVAGAHRRAAWLVIAFLPLFLLSVVIGTTAWCDGVLGRRYTWAKTGRAADRVVAA